MSPQGLEVHDLVEIITYNLGKTVLLGIYFCIVTHTTGIYKSAKLLFDVVKMLTDDMDVVFRAIENGTVVISANCHEI